MNIRRSFERGHANHGWLDTHHSFSFADYYDPDWMGYANLRVINDDRIAAGMGFGEHPHRNMEIITYMLEGSLMHRDSMGHGEVIQAGEVQYMSAGTGVRHSEFNPDPTHGTHLLQIWIEPDRTGVAPQYAQQRYSAADKRGRLLQIVKPDSAAATDDNQRAIAIRAQASVWAGWFDGTESARRTLSPEHAYYLHIAQGSISVNGTPLAEGDAAMLDGKSELVLSDGVRADVLLFELVK